MFPALQRPRVHPQRSAHLLGGEGLGRGLGGWLKAQSFAELDLGQHPDGASRGPEPLRFRQLAGDVPAVHQGPAAHPDHEHRGAVSFSNQESL